MGPTPTPTSYPNPDLAPCTIAALEPVDVSENEPVGKPPEPLSPNEIDCACAVAANVRSVMAIPVNLPRAVMKASVGNSGARGESEYEWRGGAAQRKTSQTVSSSHSLRSHAAPSSHPYVALAAWR